MIYLVNLSEKDFLRKKSKWLPKIKEYVDKNDPGAMIIPFSGAFEQKLMDMESDEERKVYTEETKCISNLDKIVVQVSCNVKYLFNITNYVLCYLRDTKLCSCSISLLLDLMK